MQDGGINLRVMRILFGIDLLLLYVVYNLVAFLMKKDITSLKLEDKESNLNKIDSMERSFQVFLDL